MSAIPFPAPPADSAEVVALRAEFRAFVDGLDKTGTAGREAFLSLMAVQGAFDLLQDAADAQAAAAAYWKAWKGDKGELA